MDVTTLDLGLPHVASGKVREIFDAGEHLLMVATDRVSVFDVVLPTPIPEKGCVLTGLSNYWFGKSQHIVPNHLVAWRKSDLPSDDPSIIGRSMLVRKAEMLPIECVVRGYLVGSGWKDYQATGTTSGAALPAGLEEASELPSPIFTPARKSHDGHDENVDMPTARALVNNDRVFDACVEASIALYELGRDFAATKGIILADTKFEFGLVDGELTLCDEALTPDSSRYWPAESYAPGSNPPSFDKQFVRDFAAGLGWNKCYPGPELSDEVVAGTRMRYITAYEALTGSSFDNYLSEASQ